jgi:hypothetical protein
VGLLTESRSKAAKKKPSRKSNEENKMTGMELCMKNQINVSVEVHTQENGHDGKTVSPNQGRYLNVFLFHIDTITTK